MPQPLHQPEEIRNWCEVNVPLSELPARQHFRAQLVGGTEEQGFSHPDLPPRPNQAFPFVGVRAELPRQQHFDLSMKKIPRRRIVRTHRLRPDPAPPPKQPRRKHPRVVEHDQVPGPQQSGEIPKLPVLKCARLPVQPEHARSRAVGQRFLRD